MPDYVVEGVLFCKNNIIIENLLKFNCSFERFSIKLHDVTERKLLVKNKRNFREYRCMISLIENIFNGRFKENKNGFNFSLL